MSSKSTPMGRPPYKPTARSRSLVIKRVASGLMQKSIASELKISVSTLQLHFEEELREGRNLYRRVLLDRLDRESYKGSVMATKALLAATATPLPGEVGEQETVAPTAALGKKAQRKIDAQTAGIDNEWGSDLHPSTVLKSEIN